MYVDGEPGPDPTIVPAERLRRRGGTRAHLGARALTVIPAEGSHLAAADRAELEAARPRTRGDCAEGLRPCPFVGCKHHLFLDVNLSTGAIKLNFPDRAPDELGASCALDVAELGGTTLDEVGNLTNLTRERVRQIEARVLVRIRLASPSEEDPGGLLLRPDAAPAPTTKRAVRAATAGRHEAREAAKVKRVIGALKNDPTRTNAEIAEQTGVGTAMVARYRTRLGLPARRRGRRAGTQETW